MQPTKVEQKLIGSLKGIKTVCELGNKRDANGKSYKPWYQKRGIKYTAIDWNGLDGALALDMQNPIDVEQIGGPFDLLTNFGTTEHIFEQEPCWENVHKLVKVGGVSVHHTPLWTGCQGRGLPAGGWERHGYWHPTLDWYKEFAKLNGYDVEQLDADIAWSCRLATMVRLRKVKDLPFTFPSIPILRSPLEWDGEPKYGYDYKD